MAQAKQIFRILIWIVFLSASTLGLLRIILPNWLDIETAKIISYFYWSGLLLVEIVLAVLVVYFFVKKPSRRTRLVTLSICHFTVFLVLPLALNDWTYTAILYPWPHTLQAFDDETSKTILWLSLFVGFGMIPLISYIWGRKAFCGYICPHGAFISETYGRIFKQHPERLVILNKIVPPIYFSLMTVALLVILILPETLTPVRSFQKVVFLITAELLYFIVLVPLVGGRSYCNLICPLGYAIKQISTFKTVDSPNQQTDR